MMTTEMKPATDSFYVTGGTLRRDAACYVQRRADQALYDGLMQGKFCYVLTSRQMGKSSLMVRTAARLREEGVHVAVLDLTSIGQNLNAEQWYDGLLARVGQQLQLEDELEDFWLANPRLSPLLRWMKAIREVVLPRLTGRIVMFVDEIDAVRSLPFSTDEFFAAIRELYNRRTEDAELERLTFCLLGVASPSDLIRDTRTTPFNIGQRIELSDFTDDEAAPLKRGLGREDKIAAKLLKRILYWTGGHPYLTQRLCQATAADANVSDAAGIDRLCEELFFTTRARERDDNLLFVRERLLKSEADRAALLDLYKKLRENKRVRDDETNPLISVLRLSGITRVAEGLLYVRNRIYYRVFDREWVLANLPDAEVQRQKAAYRRGLLRAAAVAAVIVAALSVLSFVAIRQRNRAVQSEQANRRLAYTAQMILAGKDWEDANIGRMRELLNAHIPQPGQEDLRSFEWYYFWRLSHSELFTLQHADYVMAVAFSPDGKRLVTGSWDHTAKLWDATTGQELITLKGHTNGVNSVVFSPDGKRLATGSHDQTVKLWDATTGQELITLKGHAGIMSVAFSPDGKRLAIGSEYGPVGLWDATTGRELLTLDRHTNLAVAFSPDGKRLATGSSDYTAKLWDATTGQELLTLKGHLGGINDVTFSADGKLLATGSGDRTVKVWNTTTGRELLTLRGHTKQVTSVAFSPDDKRLATGSFDRTVKLWNTTTGRELLTLKGHSKEVLPVVFSPDGKRLATGSMDHTVQLWDVSTRRHQPLTLLGYNGITPSVAFSQDGKYLAMKSDNRTVKLWDAITGQEMSITFKGHLNEVKTVAFSPDGKQLATASADCTAKLWDATTGQELLTLKGHTNDVAAVVFSPDGKRVATGGYDDTIKLWDTTTGQELLTLKGWPSFGAIAFSPDGRRLAIKGDGNTVRVCEVATGRELLTLKGHGKGTHLMGVAFSPDGKRLATGSYDQTAKLWDATTGEELLTLKGHLEGVIDVTFSPDGKLLVTGSWDQTVKLWDVATGQELFTLYGHERGVGKVVFSFDGKRLLTRSFDGIVKLWESATDADVQARRGQ